MADSNFLLSSTLGKPETQALGVGNWKFYTRMCSWRVRAICFMVADSNVQYIHSNLENWRARAISPVFHNGQCKISISVDTQKTGVPNFGWGGGGGGVVGQLLQVLL